MESPLLQCKSYDIHLANKIQTDNISDEGSDGGEANDLLLRNDSFLDSEPSCREVASMPDLYRTVKIPVGGSWWSKLFAFLGPGLLIAVGYMDPGNWMTDIAAGAAFNYKLLFVVFSTSLIAMFLQALSLRLGMVTRKDIAQLCRSSYSPGVVLFLWITAEIAIIACDLAEVIGSAVALKLLFNIPLIWGVVITAFDVIVLLVLSGKSMRWVEGIVLVLMTTIIGCFVVELWFAKPDAWAIIKGTLWPSTELVTNTSMLYIGVGIMGATIMPHNLYLHSSIVQSRDTPLNLIGMRESLHFATIDSTISLTLAFVVNASILILVSQQQLKLCSR